MNSLEKELQARNVLSVELVAAYVRVSTQEQKLHGLSLDAQKMKLEEYAKEIGMKLIIGGTYDLRPFVTNVAGNIDARCGYCYRVRMEETAKYAAENGYDSFTTTLLISPYQNHEMICAVANSMAEKYGVKEAFIGNLGAVIGSHAGPGTLALFFMGREK